MPELLTAIESSKQEGRTVGIVTAVLSSCLHFLFRYQHLWNASMGRNCTDKDET
ncbi:MAG: hypothetical protein ABFC57_13435 [Veillonellales bacterium]